MPPRQNHAPNARNNGLLARKRVTSYLGEKKFRPPLSYAFVPLKRHLERTAPRLCPARAVACYVGGREASADGGGYDSRTLLVTARNVPSRRGMVLAVLAVLNVNVVERRNAVLVQGADGEGEEGQK